MKYNLERFKDAQRDDYETALREIRSGRKRSHWIWYIFPQLEELGYSPTAKYYGIKNRKEAEAYIEDNLLRERLVEISRSLLSLDCNDALKVMGYPDNLKLKSCMTLFDAVAPDLDVFGKVLEKFYSGERDERTIDLLERT